MAIDPTQIPGASAPQGLSNTQINMPAPAEGMMPQDPIAAAMMQQQAPPPPQEKPHSLIPTDIARLLAEAINEAKMGAAKNLVDWVGDPRGTVHVKDADILRVWRKKNPEVDPLFEKFVNGQSDEEIMYMVYPLRRALIRYGRRTYKEQVEFAEKMAKLDLDPRFDYLDEEIEDDEDSDEGYEPPTADFPSKGEMNPDSAEEEVE